MIRPQRPIAQLVSAAESKEAASKEQKVAVKHSAPTPAHAEGPEKMLAARLKELEELQQNITEKEKLCAAMEGEAKLAIEKKEKAAALDRQAKALQHNPHPTLKPWSSNQPRCGYYDLLRWWL